VLLKAGNKGFSFDRLVGACVEHVELSIDSQVLTTARDHKPCDQKQLVLAKTELGRFQGSPAHKTESDAKIETKRAVGSRN
jgi:hypothetical protein